MRSLALIPIVLLFVTGKLAAQGISGIVNHYLHVVSITADTLYYSTSPDAAIFQPGDKVLLIQMTGTLFHSLSSGTGNRGVYVGGGGTFNNYRNCGQYEILQIAWVNHAQQKMIFTADFLNTYNNDEKVQLVRVAEYENITVSGTITAKAWDGQSGGIAVLMAYDTLRLNAPIDVSNKGFRGGQPETGYTGFDAPCREAPDTINFFPYETNRAGEKGEGNITASFPYTLGAFYRATGGGGGNGLYAGGGGGSNFGFGGNGGRQSMVCEGTLAEVALGGMPDNSLYINNRVTMGGGGGAGTEGISILSTPGGTGGGIAILLANVLLANNQAITAIGEAITVSATASGGGGGGGGTVLLDINQYQGTLAQVSVRGGKGGNTTSTGSGGGGGGGVIWHSGSSADIAVFDTSRGLAGTTMGFPTQGTAGGFGRLYQSLILPLNGFLFNTIKSADTICAGQQPKLLTGSQPKGGNGIYTYLWQQSTNETTWTTAMGAGNTQRDFTPSPLSSTTWFRRVVTSEPVSGLQTDTSRTVKIFVFPAIGNNLITGSDSLCQGLTPNALTGTNNPTGGNGTHYRFQWQVSDDNISFANRGEQTTIYTNLPEDPLNTTHYYRRVVTSTDYCTNISDTITLRVMPHIVNNKFSTPDTLICENQDQHLKPLMPLGGFGYYNYQWQKYDYTSWTNITGANEASLVTGPLAGTTLYRRITYSGNHLRCIDTSGLKTVNVTPLIKNNVINGATHYACSNSEKPIAASLPFDGQHGDYGYQWQFSTNGTTWTSAPGSMSTSKDYVIPGITVKSYFRRIVYSSASFRQCQDTSTHIEVLINELPVASMQPGSDTICAGGQVKIMYTVAGNSPPWLVTPGFVETALPFNRVTEAAGTDSMVITLEESQDIILFSVRDDSLCFADLTNLTPHTVKVYQNPVTNAGVKDEVCGLQYTLNATKSIEGSVGSWSHPKVTFDNPSLEYATVTCENYGPVYLKWTEKNWQCTHSDSVLITFFEQPTEAEAGTDQLLDFTFRTRLDATPANVGKGAWTVATGHAFIEEVNEPDTHIRGLSFENLLYWTIANGPCPVVTDSLLILINPLKVKKGFMPGGKPENSRFSFTFDNAEKISITIYNRLGQLVYKADDYNDTNFWDGSGPGGGELTEGTYFYILRVKIADKEEEFIHKSYVELIRR